MIGGFRASTILRNTHILWPCCVYLSKAKPRKWWHRWVPHSFCRLRRSMTGWSQNARCLCSIGASAHLPWPWTSSSWACTRPIPEPVLWPMPWTDRIWQRGPDQTPGRTLPTFWPGLPCKGAIPFAILPKLRFDPGLSLVVVPVLPLSLPVAWPWGKP